MAITRRAIVDSFANRYGSTTKQDGKSSRLNALKIDNVGRDEGDEYEALHQHTKRINQFAPMARPRDHDDEANVRFLTKAVEGTEWTLNSQRRLPTEPSFQILRNEHYSSMRELDAFRDGSAKEPGTSTANFLRSLWRDSTEGRK